MKFTRNVKAISKLLLVLLLLLAMIVGAILSYLWVMGYYISLDRVYPEDVTINITECTFDEQNPSFFNVTIQCPTSYKSKEPANITQIMVSTEDGVLHDEIDTGPSLPYKFQNKGELETFNCLWNWANYTGETIEIIALVAEGSGSAFEVEAPSVELTIIAVNATVADTTYFNVTLYNSEDSVIDLDVTQITLTMEDGTILEITEIDPSLPHLLSPGSHTMFKCSWNWTNYRGRNATIIVYTSQGHIAYSPLHTTDPILLTVESVLFDPANTTYFNATVLNSEYSVTQANITLITVTDPYGEIFEVTVEPPPSLPYSLPPAETVTLKCLWDWTSHYGQGGTVMITVGTSDGYWTYPMYYTLP